MRFRWVSFPPFIWMLGGHSSRTSPFGRSSWKRRGWTKVLLFILYDKSQIELFQLLFFAHANICVSCRLSITRCPDVPIYSGTDGREGVWRGLCVCGIKHKQCSSMCNLMHNEYISLMSYAHPSKANALIAKLLDKTMAPALPTIFENRQSTSWGAPGLLEIAYRRCSMHIDNR